MLREGHLGIGLLVYIPVAAILVIFDHWVLLAIGVWATVIGASFPDLDTRVRFVKHRGWTHTVWFMLVMAIGGSILGVFSIQWIFGFFPLVADIVPQSLGIAAAGMFAGGMTLGVGSHLVGDLVTREGIRPFHPVLPRDVGGLTVSKTRYHWGSLRAKNRLVNTMFLGAGVLGLSAVIVLVETI